MSVPTQTACASVRPRLPSKATRWTDMALLTRPWAMKTSASSRIARLRSSGGKSGLSPVAAPPAVAAGAFSEPMPTRCRTAQPTPLSAA